LKLGFEIIEKLRVMIPELLAANGLPDDDVPFELLTRRFKIVRRTA